MKHCDRKEDLITYLYGEMDAEQERAFRRHLLSCSSCRVEEASFRAVRTSLQSWQLGDVPQIVVPLEATKRKSIAEYLEEMLAVFPMLRYAAVSAVACLVMLTVAAALNTEIRYDATGFSVKLGLFNKVETAALSVDEQQVKALIEAAVREREAQLRQEIEVKIALLDKELSEKNATLLSKAARELKLEQRLRLQRALMKLEQERNYGIRFEQDPFNLWGGVSKSTSWGD
ncbi:MAG: zf-HC2 domain-containing protein [Acidobacteriota bacterium]|nr:zf-HC2 domain-containing protein [Blastocatellia bacterium]MDW8411640.1 zf-HC2 domain-containing protein [Acidobacteriota bacterium]